MKTRTGAYLEAQRHEQHLSPQQLAAAIGYKNLHKGGNRILALEREGRSVEGLLEKAIAVLGLDGQHVQHLVAEDQRQFEDEWNRWANEPVAPELRYRVMPVIWRRVPLPTNLSRDEAIEFARTQAMDQRKTYLLIWSRREEIWCYEDGRTFVRLMKIGEVAGPVMRLRGRGNRGFTFR